MSSTVSGTRITGMATGMDTDSMIKSMLTADQEKIDNVKAEEQILTWQQEAYQEIIGDVKSLTDKYFSLTSPDSILSSKSWNTVEVSSTNSSVITATGTSGASNIDYSFNVKQLATGASLSTSKTTTNGENMSLTTSLKDLGLTGNTEFKIKTSEGMTETIKLEETDTVDSMIKKLNEASGGNYKASFSEMTGEFKIESTKTGVNASLQIVDNDGNQSKALEFLSDSNIYPNSFSIEQNGTNAQITVTTANGKTVDLDKESNNFTIDGINYSVHSTGESKLTSKQNNDQIVDKMKSFVEEYNSLMDKIYKDLIEKKNKDYQPLTDEQKKEMSEDEIKKWEEKAKAGILKNDSDLRKFMDDMNKAIFGDNTEFMLSIGISGPTDYNKKGQLTFDEEKFRKALNENGQEVYNKLAGDSNSVFENVKKTINNYVGSSSSVFAKKAGIQGTASVANNYYSKEITKKETLIKELTNKMTKKENALYQKFANLESTMNKLNAQMQQFMQS